MQAKKFTIYSKHSIPQPGNMNLPLGSHINRPLTDPETTIGTF